MERKGILDKSSKEVVLNGRVYWTRVREKWAWNGRVYWTRVHVKCEWNGRVSLDKGSNEVGGEWKEAAP